MKWYRLIDTYEYKWKTHIIPECLYKSVTEGLHERGWLQYESLDNEYCCLDLPGIISINRGYVKLCLDGLSIEIPYTDFSHFYNKISNLNLRDDSNEPYYKLHCNYSCLCLTEEQKNHLLELMTPHIAEAKAMANIENKAFNEAFTSDKAMLADSLEDAAKQLRTKDTEKVRVIVQRRPVDNDIGEA